MQSYEFAGFINKLCNFYERKEPKREAFNLWFDIVEKIPSNELDSIFDMIARDSETFPRNVTGLMWKYHHELVQQNLISTAEKVYIPCSECLNGLLHLQKKNDAGIFTKYVFRCDTCKQRKENYPWGNKWILAKEGYEEMPITEGAEKITSAAELMAFITDFKKLPF